jgi:hypothetical protein
MGKDLTKEDLAREMRIIMKHPDISNYTKRYYLTNVAIQQWTENFRDGNNSKFLGCVYWSKEAIFKYQENLEILNLKKTENPTEILPFKPEKGLQHEHVIPKNWLISKVFLDKDRLQQVEEDEIEYITLFLEDFTFACVVTNTEHRRINKPNGNGNENYTSIMPPNAFENGTNHPDYHKYWLRYKLAGVEVYKLKWSDDRKTAVIEGGINTDMTDWENPLNPDVSRNTLTFK